MGLINQSRAWNALTSIHRQGNDTCDNPFDLPHTHAVNGTLCIPEGE